MPDSTTTPAPEVQVHARGPASEADVTYAHRKISAVAELPSSPVLSARVELVVHRDPAREEPVFAKAELDLNGRVVRAHATGSTPMEAIDALEDRLRTRVERSVHRPVSAKRRHRDEAHWHHGDESTELAPFFPRPAEEREIVRRKTFAVGATSPEDAVLELEALDHDFYLFTDADDGEDCVLHRIGDQYELLRPTASSAGSDPESAIVTSPRRPPSLTEEEAIQLLEVADEPFVFFLDRAGGRGRVAYRRYDGHYGLIVPSE